MMNLFILAELDIATSHEFIECTERRKICPEHAISIVNDMCSSSADPTS